MLSFLVVMLREYDSETGTRRIDIDEERFLVIGRGKYWCGGKSSPQGVVYLHRHYHTSTLPILASTLLPLEATVAPRYRVLAQQPPVCER